MSSQSQNPFKWRHFQADIILLCVRWYLRYALSYRDLEEMIRERGLYIDHTTIYRRGTTLRTRIRKALPTSSMLKQPNVSSRKRLLHLIPALLTSSQLIKTRPIPKLGSELKAEGIMPEPSELRQCKYLNNLVEQDHRFLKRLVKLGMGFFSFETAWRTRAGDMKR